MSRCPTAEQLSAYLEGTLPQDELATVQSHLPSCTVCKSRIGNLQSLPEAASRHAANPVRSRSKENLRAAVNGPSAIEVDVLPPQLGPYVLLTKLGQGAMGAVFQARHTKLDRIEAVKILPPKLMRHPDAVERFEREMRAVAKLDHPHIVRAHHAGEESGQHYLVMEYVDGCDVGALVKQWGRLGIADACEIVRQAAEGLQHAHEHGLVHRDIKPSNLIVSRKGVVKILDLGLALAGNETVAVGELTSTGQIMGTLDYMAPEQGDDSHQVDIRADLYSLGATLYHLLAGRPPFGGRKHTNSIQKLKALANEEPRPIRELRADVPVALAALVHRLLAKQPQDRFATPAEVVTQLQGFTDQHDLRAVVNVPTPLPADGVVLPSASTYDCSSLPVAGTQRSLVGLSPRLDHGDDGDVPRDDRIAVAAPPPPNRTNRRRLFALVGAIAFALLGVVIFRVSTDRGDLVITSSDPGVKVAIKKSGRTVKELELTHGDNKVTVYSGDYEVELTGPFDGLTVKDGQFTLTRGDTRQVHIERVPNAAASVVKRDPSTSGPVGGQKVTASGKEWHGWPANAPAPAIAPFDADQATLHQAAWAKFLKVPVEYTNSIGMRFRLIPPGEFLMGSTEEDIARVLRELGLDGGQANGPQPLFFTSQAPLHRTLLTQPFYLGLYEVTQGNYQTVLGKDPSHFSATGPGKAAVAGIQTKDFPVEFVSWIDATRFCDKLSTRERFEAVYFANDWTEERPPQGGYRLPTEAEWEYACRAGTQTEFWTGNGTAALREAAWIGRNEGQRTHAVGELKPNPFGLFDIHGNVWEWCQDRWDPKSYEQFRDQPAIDPPGPSIGTSRVYRGGCWYDFHQDVHAANRHAAGPSERGNNGFRVALPLEVVREAVRRRSQPATAVSENSSTPAERKPRTIDGPPGAKERIWKSADLQFKEIHGQDMASVRRWMEVLQIEGFRPIHYSAQTGSAEPRFNAVAIKDQEKIPFLFNQRLTFQERDSGVYRARAEHEEFYIRTLVYYDIDTVQFCDQIFYPRRGQGWGGWGGDRDWLYDNIISAQKKGKYIRPCSIHTWRIPGKQQFSCHFCPYDGVEWDVSFNILPADLPQQMKALQDKNWLPDFLASYVEQGQLKFMLIVVENKDRRPWSFKMDLSAADLEQALKASLSESLRPGVIDSYGELTSPKYALILRALPSLDAQKASGGIPSVPREFIAKRAGEERDDNGLKMKFCWCPDGEFLMGSPKDEQDRQPNEDQTQVQLTGFWVGKYEVTQSEWQNVMGTKPWNSLSDSSNVVREGATYPATHVNWDDATKFCEKLTVQDLHTGRLPAGWSYRLPTEAQWEYACRAGTKTATAFGDKLSSTQANFVGDHPYNLALKGPTLKRATTVGSYQPNAWGLCDLHGNINEWCRDWYDPQHRPEGRNPEVTTQQPLARRMCRGGSFGDYGGSCRSAGLRPFEPALRIGVIGFRVARVQTPQPLIAPFDTATAKAAQQAWAKSLGEPSHFKKNSIGMELALIPPGRFVTWTGSSANGSQRRNEDREEFVVLKPFWIGKHEVTVGQFRQFVTAMDYATERERNGIGTDAITEDAPEGYTNKSDPQHGWRNPGYPQTDEHPVVNVSWDDAAAFCEWLSRQDGKTYRLPTAIEWDYACRSGTTTDYFSGDDPESLVRVANIADATLKAKFPGRKAKTIAAEDGYVFTAPVGKYPANHFGLHDMHGNVKEWLWDFDSQNGKLPKQHDPDNPSAPDQRGGRMNAGGSFMCLGHMNLPCYRSYSGGGPKLCLPTLGFRVVCVPGGAP